MTYMSKQDEELLREQSCGVKEIIAFVDKLRASGVAVKYNRAIGEWVGDAQGGGSIFMGEDIAVFAIKRIVNESAEVKP